MTGTALADPDTPQEPLTPPAGGLDQDLPCWRCGYNLRGLTAPRCPECGLAFTWEELLDPEVRPHPFLWEHHRHDRPLRSYVRSCLGVLRPFKLWRGVHLRQFPDGGAPGRLLGYSLAALLVLVMGGGLLIKAFDAFNHRAIGVVPPLFTWSGRPAPGSAAKSDLERFTERLLDADEPFEAFWLLPSAAFVVPASIVLLTWGTLMLYPASLQRGKILAHHVRRAVAYSCGVWVLGAAVGGGGLAVYAALASSLSADGLAGVVVAGVIVGALWWYLSLLAAYVCYVRVRQGGWMLLFSLIIVALVWLNILVLIAIN